MFLDFLILINRRVNADCKMATFIEDVYDIAMKIDGFNVVKCLSEDEPCLTITHKILYYHPPFGMTSRCQISVRADEFTVHVLMREVDFNDPVAIRGICARYSLNSVSHKFCPGLNPSDYEQQRDIIRFDLKSVRQTQEPFSHVDSVKCNIWSELGKVSLERRKADTVLCRACVRLKCDLEHQVKRTSAECRSKKIKRQCSSSHARTSYMSPTSVSKRKYNQKIARRTDRRKLEYTELPLDNDQDNEMENVMSTIESTCSNQLENLFAEGEAHNVGDKLRNIWYSDKWRECTEFQRQQTCNSEVYYYTV